VFFKFPAFKDYFKDLLTLGAAFKDLHEFDAAVMINNCNLQEIPKK